MEIRFGRVDYLWAKPNEKIQTATHGIEAVSSHHGEIFDTLSQEAAKIDSKEKLSIASSPHMEWGNHPYADKREGYLSRVLTGKDAKCVLDKMGIKVSCKDPKEINDQKIIDGVRNKYGEDLSLEQISDILSTAVEAYTDLHEIAKGKINHIDVIV